MGPIQTSLSLILALYFSMGSRNNRMCGSGAVIKRSMSISLIVSMSTYHEPYNAPNLMIAAHRVLAIRILSMACNAVATEKSPLEASHVYHGII